MIRETPKKPVPGISLMLSLLMTGMYLMFPIQALMGDKPIDASTTGLYFVLTACSWCCSGLQGGMASPESAARITRSTLVIVGSMTATIVTSVIAYLTLAQASTAQNVILILAAPAMIVPAFMLGKALGRFSKYKPQENS